MKNEVPVIRLNLWLETAEGLYFGLGRAMLLSKIEQHGSLRKAADELGIAYRAAWGKIKKSEEILGAKLIEQTGSRRGGYRLTEAGKTLMESYLAWFDHLEQEALKTARELLPVPVRGFRSSEQ